MSELSSLRIQIRTLRVLLGLLRVGSMAFFVVLIWLRHVDLAMCFMGGYLFGYVLSGLIERFGADQ